jgi:membrane-bound metal-dependent hydrolase YbcI (DUF457 family)
MLPLLVALMLVLTAADHWTTYVCLRAPVSGWVVSEANPLAAWLFQHFGLGPAIALDTTVTLLAVASLVATPLIPLRFKQVFFAGVALWTAWAVVNNVQAIAAMGLSPLGGV